MADADFNVKAIISAQTSQFEKGIKNAQSSVNSLSSSISNITNLVKKAFAFTGVAIGTKAIVDFGKSAVQSATQATKQFNILDNTIKATGADAWTTTKEMDSMAKELSDSTNYSVTEIEKMQSVLLGFRDITGDTFKDASDAVLDMATVMGMDLTSAVQTVGKALDDPIKGLDSLRRQGFAFTDEQKAELKQLVATGKKIEAQKIILEELATTYGGAAKAGQYSFAKQRHAVENFKDTLGGKLIPLMKSFAIDNANMINSLREYLNQIDFNQIGATIKVTFEGIKKGIQNSFEYVKMIFSETKSFMKNIDFKPIISIINNLVLAFEKIGKINLNRVTNIIKDLKDSFSGFSENIDLTKFSEVINLIINGFVFLYEEVNKVFDILLDDIKTFIINTWNSIKSIFEAGNKALADSETDIKSWGDYFYTIFNNLFKTVQDVIQSISYLLSGDWEIAWQYAKLVVLRIVDSVIDSMTTMVTAFKDKIISILNFAQMLSPFLGTSGKVIKTALSGIEALVDGVDKNSKKIKDTMTELVKDTENKIEELTGKPADKNIEELEKFTSGSKNILGEFVDNFKEATTQAKKELDNLSGEYKTTTNSMKDDGKSTYEAYSEWDSKLLQQRLENLNEWEDEYHDININLIEQERKKALESAKTDEERAKINEYYDKEIEKENKRHEEAKRAHAKQTMKAITGYLKNIASTAVQVFKKVAETIKNVFSKIGGFIKNIFSVVKNIFSKLFEFNIDDALDNLLKFEDAVLTFFVETLPKLPAFFESALSSISVLIQTLINSIDWDKIGDFLNQIIDTFVKYGPEIVKGIVEIFSKLVVTVAKAIGDNSDVIVNAIGEMVFAVIEALPEIISTLLKALGNLLSSIGTYIKNNGERLTEDLKNIVHSFIEGITSFVKSGGWKNLLDALLTIQKAIETAVVDNLDDIVNTIIDALPDLIQFLVDSIISASKTLGKIVKPLFKGIIAIIMALLELLNNDEVVDQIVETFGEITEGVFSAIIEMLPQFLRKTLPKIIKMVVRSLISLPIEMARSIFKGLTNAFKNANFGEIFGALFEGLGEILGGVAEEIGHAITEIFLTLGDIIQYASEQLGSFIKWMTDGIQYVLEGVGKNIWKFFESIRDGIFNFFVGVQNTFFSIGDGIKNAFEGVGDGIKNAFEGIGKWFNNLGENIWKTFEGIGDGIKNAFSGVGNGIKSAFEGIGNWFNNLWDGITKGASSACDKLKDGFKWAVDGIKGFFEGLRKSVENIFSQIGNGIKSAINGVIWTVNQVIAGINSVVGWTGIKINSIGYLAKGTEAAQKGLYLVGEAGPELVNFRGGEQVINNKNTQKLLANNGSSEGNTFNVTFNNTQDTTAYAMIRQLKQYNRQMAINGII